MALLERCTQELHQVQGVLRVLEIYGAALLAEEMEHVAQYLLATATERKGQAESLDALMRAMVQLPSYLERVLAGGRDLALVLLPLLNDLRAVRGSSLLSEGTLLLLNLKSDKQAQPIAAPAGEPPLDGRAVGRGACARASSWGSSAGSAASASSRTSRRWPAVAQKLEQIATRQPVFQLWWVIGRGHRGAAASTASRAVSRSSACSDSRDREIRRLYEQGEARYCAEPAGRAPQQPAVLRRPRRVQGRARHRGARLLPPGGAAAGR